MISTRLPVLLGVILLGTLPVVFPKSGAKPQAPKPGESLIYSVKGPDLYHEYCAAFHGTDAKGDGPMAASLKDKVPDLTLLARRNNGQFPGARVRRIIAGDEDVRSHGTRAMPVWGPIFHQIEYDQDLGAVRIDNLAKYLESIQRK